MRAMRFGLAWVVVVLGASDVVAERRVPEAEKPSPAARPRRDSEFRRRHLVLPEYVHHSEATIGFEAIALPASTARALGGGAGLLVTWVRDGGPAGRAGLEVGDLVSGIGGRPALSADGLVRPVDAWPERPLPLDVLREGRSRALTLVPEPYRGDRLYSSPRGIGVVALHIPEASRDRARVVLPDGQLPAALDVQGLFWRSFNEPPVPCWALTDARGTVIASGPALGGLTEELARLLRE